MSLVCGCDYSSKAIDFVFLDEDALLPPDWWRVELAGQDSFDRARTVRSAIHNHGFERWDNIVAFGIEDPAGNHGVRHIARIQGGILQALPEYLLVKPWAPSQWRKAVGLPGNCSKQDVAAHVLSHRDYPLHPGDAASLAWPQDACDAYCIALATLNALTKEAAA